MKKTMLLILTFLFNLTYSQIPADHFFSQLFAQKKYDEIINYTAAKNEQLSTEALYYKAKVYYLRSEDDKASHYLDLAIAQGPVFGDLFYHKGMISLYANKLKESLIHFDQSIALSPDESNFYAGKGEAFSAMQNLDSAQVYFEKAVQFTGAEPRAYIKLGVIYQGQNRNEEALTVFETALSKLRNDDEMFQSVSFNVGLTQQLTGRSTAAKETFQKHLSAYPNDYHVLAKLIQLSNELSETDDAAAYKKRLYAAYKADLLNSDMNRSFCFGQFDWNGRKVLAYEVFADPEGKDLFNKHHFYVTDDTGEIDYSIDSELISGIENKDPGEKYVLCLVKNKIHSTYWQYVFGENYQYSELKDAVLNILNKKVKPSASFFPGK